MNDSIELVENDTPSPKLTIYTNSNIQCPYCIRAKQALLGGSYVFEERDIADPVVKAELMEKRPTARTVPQIFLIDGTHLGGCEDLLILMEKKDGQSTLDLMIDLVS